MQLSEMHGTGGVNKLNIYPGLVKKVKKNKCKCQNHGSNLRGSKKRLILRSR